jgi:hypothetical protein
MRRSERWERFIGGLKIRTRDRRIAPLRFNAPQQRVWDGIREKIDHLEPIRLIVLKARREGISTLIESLLMTFIVSGDNVNALVTAHMKKPAHTIWNMSKLFVTSSPLLHRLATIGNSTITVGRSTLQIATAGSPESERGGDLTAAHFSEGAFYPHKGFLTAAMQSLPHTQSIFSIGVIESTANGVEGDGEDFYNEWSRASEGDSDWQPLFLAWHSFPDYAIPHTRHLEDLDEEEYELRHRFELSDGQLAWRRWAVKNNCKGQVQIFRAEYPATAEEAFVQSGLPFFQPHELLWMHGHLRDGMRGTVEPDGTFRRAPDGYLEIFQPPQAGHTYVIGADSSMGIQDRADRKEHSRSAACVLDMDTLEQVAEYDAASAPHIFARHLTGMARLYHNALLAPEVQSSGGGGGREVMVYIRELGYWNLHQWKGDPDKIRRHNAILYGWECVAPSAQILTADLRWVRADTLQPGDEILGCQETPRMVRGGNLPRLGVQRILSTRAFTAPMVEVRLADGRRTRVSTTHPFWAKRPGCRGQWREAATLQPGDVLRCLPVWTTLQSYAAGRLSGFLDGEGHLSQGRRYGLHMLISQAEGPLADEITQLWSDMGFEATFKWARHKRPQDKPLAVMGPVRLAEVLRALGSLRPTRLLRKFMEVIELDRLSIRGFVPIQVAEVRPIGEGTVIGLETGPDHTLIADGIVGHNTNSKTRPRMLARIREVVMEKSVIIHSKRLFTQLSAFGEDDHGHMEALAGRDDLLFAFGIGLMSRSENYYVVPSYTEPTAQVDWQAMGIHVTHPESPGDRLRRLLVSSPHDPGDKTFLES